MMLTRAASVVARGASLAARCVHPRSVSPQYRLVMRPMPFVQVDGDRGAGAGSVRRLVRATQRLSLRCCVLWRFIFCCRPL